MSQAFRLSLPIIVIGIIYFAAALAFNAATPYRTAGELINQPGGSLDIGAPDERQHANYIAHLLKGNGLPVFDPNDPNLYESYQSHQPPLYYLVAAGYCKILGIDPTDPDQGSGIRFFSTLIGLATLAGTFFATLWATTRLLDAICALAFTALLPMHVALNAAVSNDPMLFAICAWTLALLIKAIRYGWSPKICVGIGILVGAGVATKTSGLVLIPTVIAAWFLTSSASGNRMGWKSWLWCGVPIVAIVVPLVMRNFSLYGEPFALQVFQQAFSGTMQRADLQEQLGGAGAYWFGAVGALTLKSLIGVFGYMDVFLFETSPLAVMNAVYNVAILFLAGSIAACGYVAVRKQPDMVPRSVTIMLMVFAALVLLAFIRFNMTYFQAQARYLIPALPVLAMFAGIGIARVLKENEYAWLLPTAFWTAYLWLSYQTMAIGFPIRTGGQG